MRNSCEHSCSVAERYEQCLHVTWQSAKPTPMASLKEKLKARLRPENKPHKLTSEQIGSILRRVANGETMTSVAAEHGVSMQAVRYHIQKAIEE